MLGRLPASDPLAHELRNAMQAHAGLPGDAGLGSPGPSRGAVDLLHRMQAAQDHLHHLQEEILGILPEQ